MLDNMSVGGQLFSSCARGHTQGVKRLCSLVCVIKKNSLIGLTAQKMSLAISYSLKDAYKVR